MVKIVAEIQKTTHDLAPVIGAFGDLLAHDREGIRYLPDRVDVENAVLSIDFCDGFDPTTMIITCLIVKYKYGFIRRISC